MRTLTIAGLESKNILVKLWKESFIQAYTSEHSQQNIQTYCNANFTEEQASEILGDANSECIIATENEEPSGFYILRHCNCPIELDGQSSELKQIYILSDHYGTGLGKLLYENAVQSTVNANRSWLWLCVSNLNYRAQSFYDKLGFEVIGKGPDLHVGSDVLNSTIMARPIGSKS
ncbi:MAG: GNAT family N-acetyltransferase [Pseudohongiellaceae bacterium]